MGPASALYGANAFVGVINIVTRLQDRTRGSGGYVEQVVGSWSTFVDRGGPARRRARRLGLRRRSTTTSPTTRTSATG